LNHSFLYFGWCQFACGKSIFFVILTTVTQKCKDQLAFGIKSRLTGDRLSKSGIEKIFCPKLGGVFISANHHQTSLWKIMKETWERLKLMAAGFWAKLLLLLSKCREILVYMRGQVIEKLPGWKKDASEYSDDWKKRYLIGRISFRKTRLEWKAAFSKIDASPEKLHEMLFEEKTTIGKMFESLLIVLIFASVLVVMLDSVESIHRRFYWLLAILEWIFTIVFTIEYLLRIYSSPRPIRYITSSFGIIDLVTILPTYIGVIFTGAHTFLILRILRVFRIFRLLKLVNMMRAGSTITASLKASRDKISVFLIFVLLAVTVMGSVLYIVEAGSDSGFTSIPTSIYWAIVTLTTVGYGDIAPSTWLGQLIAAAIMIIGYAVIAVPTGIVSAEFMEQKKKARIDKTDCQRCGKNEHEKEARYCSRCGDRLPV
jgi:voltage-gated potassium channel